MGVGLEEPCGILYDAFTGFESNRLGQKQRRDNWKTRNNVITIAGEGKWSVHGSPADANHGHLRMLMDAAEDVLFGFDNNPRKRQRLEDLSK